MKTVALAGNAKAELQIPDGIEGRTVFSQPNSYTIVAATGKLRANPLIVVVEPPTVGE